MDDKQLKLIENAKKIARRNFKFCWREQFWSLRRSSNQAGRVSILCTISDEIDGKKKREHIWLSDVMCDGQYAYGTVDSKPSIIKHLEIGSICTVPIDRVEDWLYVLDGKAYGGYTINTVRTFLQPSERELYDQSWGLQFGNPLYTEKYPTIKKNIQVEEDEVEKPPAKIFGITIKANKKTKIVPTPDTQEKGPEIEVNREYDHPDAIKYFNNYQKKFITTPDAVNALDINDWTPLHNHALAGNRHIVRLLVENGADISITTNHGHTAADLAKIMGWMEVVRILSS